MLKISMVPILTRMISKLDIKPAIERLKALDIFDGNAEKLTAQQMGELAFEIIAELTPQLGQIGPDIPEFVALYKNCTIDEAGEYDLAEIINDIKNDEGIVNFFSVALRKKVEQEH